MGMFDIFTYGIAPVMAMPWMYSLNGKELPKTFDDVFVPIHDGIHHGLVGFLMMVGAYTALKFVKAKALSTIAKIALGVGVVLFLEDFIHEQVYRKLKGFESESINENSDVLKT